MNLVIQNPAGKIIKDAATGAERNMVRLVTSSKLPLWKKKLEACNQVHFPGLDMELRQAFTFSEGQDHLQTSPNSFFFFTTEFLKGIFQPT